MLLIVAFKKNLVEFTLGTAVSMTTVTENIQLCVTAIIKSCGHNQGVRS